MTLMPSYATKKSKLELKADQALEKLYSKIENRSILQNKAKGTLIFPSVYKAGMFFLGGEYGEGLLKVGANTVDYYNTVLLSIARPTTKSFG